MLRVAAFVGVVLAALVGEIYWIEGEKEAKILCGMATLGKPESEMLRMFGTAELLRVASTESDSTHVVHATTGGLVSGAGCEITMLDGVVVGQTQWRALPIATLATVLLMVLLPLTASAQLRRHKGHGPGWVTNAWTLATFWAVIALCLATYLLGAPRG